MMSPKLNESPTSSAFRRPPRSKHDNCISTIEGKYIVPSSEVHSRVIIGTVMLGKSQAHNSKSNIDMKDLLKSERDKTIQEVTKTTQELLDISTALEEAERSAEL